MTGGLSPVILLDETHDVTQFSCGKPAMDTWLRQHALANQESSLTRTYVTCEGNVVRGYFSLAPSTIEFRNMPESFKKANPGIRYPVGVILLARLAVDQRLQGQGIGRSLLLEALHKALRASEAIGGVAVVVDALDEEAKAFYEKYDFEPSPTGPFQLLLMMKDIDRSFA